MKKIISFPHLSNYYIPIKFLLSKLTPHEIRVAPPITKKTLEIGSTYSPDFVCVPFKYNLGNFIEVLDGGANTIIQAGGGCRFNYYGETQEVILKDLGYEFEFYSLIGENCKMNPLSIYKTLKKLNNGKLSIIKFLYYIALGFLMVRFMDNIDHYIRKNIGFEVVENSFINLQKEMLDSFSKTKSFIHLTMKYFKYKRLFKKLKVNKPKNCLKVGMVGELYTEMEGFATYNIEYQLAKMNIEVTRFTNLFFLVITKFFNKKRILKQCGDYVTYHLGADAQDNVARVLWYARNDYDGIIHTKPFGCMPEVNAIPIISNIVNKYNIPTIYLSFDSGTCDTGVKTRLEAFYDMISMRRKR